MRRTTFILLSLSLFLALPALAQPGAACREPIALNSSIDGNWTTECPSVHRNNRFARYYTFTLPQAASVRVDLDSATDNYLYLLSGSGTGGAIVAQDDNSGDGFDARIERNLAAGTYTIEATTWGSSRTGEFTLTLAATGSGGGGGCAGTISLGQGVDGTWVNDCRATHRSGSWARFYTFTVTETTTVRIDLTSSVDSYLYLLSGSGTGGTVIAQDDDSGDGVNARIDRNLSPGTYTIEAATRGIGRAGSFRLELSTAGGPPSCVEPIALDQRINGSWTSDCRATHRAGTYARFYTFTLFEWTNVRIDVTSSVDSHLFLLLGEGPDGTVIGQDNDSGGNRNAQLLRTLAPNTYTLEVTTTQTGRAGDFTVALTNLGGAGGPECGPLQTMLNSTIGGIWNDDCVSAHRPGSLARYYTFSLARPATVQVDVASAVDTSLFLFRGVVIGGDVLARDDEEGDGDARLRLRLPAGTYSVEVASAAPDQEGSFTLSLGDAARMTVFLVHGLGQQGGSLASLADTLRHPQLGIDPGRFVIDSGFDWSRCANNPECAEDCHPADGARALARYINGRDPQGQIVVIGYGLGGVLARDMMLNNYDGVATRRKVAALVTLGTPNAGYPYCPEDEETRCAPLVRDLASQLRLPGGGRILQSAYLEELNRRWSAGRNFRGRPGTWLAIAGASCTGERSCKWEEDDAEVQGCPVSGTDARRSDGEVCAWSALFQLRSGNAPNRRVTDANYSQTGVPGGPVLCEEGAANSLANPPADGTVVRAIRDVLNRLRVRPGRR